MKWQFPIFSYFWLVLCVTYVSCFLPLITLPLNLFDVLTERSRCHLHDTCYCLFSILSLFTAQKALPSPATADVKMTRLLVSCCPLGKNVTLPFLAYPLLERKASEMGNIVSAVALSTFTHKVPIPLSADSDVRPQQETTSLTAPNLSPPVTKALFLGPPRAWVSCLSEQILTKEALGPCQRDSLGCHLLR